MTESPEPRSQNSEPPPGEARHVPNYVSLDKRAIYLIGSSAIITYTVACLFYDTFLLWIPSRKHSIILYLHGTAAWLAAAAALSATSSLLSVVVDHYDTRNNEGKYKAYARSSLVLAAAFLVLALIAHALSR